MDVSMQLINNHCGESLRDYTGCVDAYPGTWQKNCDKLRCKLASCAQSHPTIKRIKQKCSETYRDYDRCVRCNPENVFNCRDELKQFSECAGNYIPRHSVLTTTSRSSSTT